MAKRSKLYRAQLASFDKNAVLNVLDALKTLKAMPAVKFDQTVEIAFKLGVDPKQTDQTVRGAVPLPKGTGKKVVVTVITDDEQLKQDALANGADFVGFDDLIEKIKGGWVDFDVLIASPAAMGKVRPLGRQLGPKGLMPNPKTGTVTDAVGAAVREAKAGRAEFRADRGACVHVPIGKLSFEADALKENFDALSDAIQKARPVSAKGTYIISCSVSATMTPGLKINLKELVRAAK